MIRLSNLFSFLALINIYLFGQGASIAQENEEFISDQKPQLIEKINIKEPDLFNTLFEEKNSNQVFSNDKKNKNHDSLLAPYINNDKQIDIKKVTRTNVQLTINTIPEKVEVFLDGNLIGKTPIVDKKILSGDHVFEIRKDGYAPISYDLNVNPSKSVNLDFFMNPVYNVKFKTDEVGLIFELNDDHRWTEDAIRMQLEAGDHQLRVYKLGEIIDEQVIVADQPLTFQYYLKRGVVVKP